MALSYKGTTYGYATGSGTTLDAVANLNVATNDLLVVFLYWEGGASTVSFSDGGSNSFTMESVANDTKNYGCFGYKIGATANAAALFTMTNGTARTYRGFRIYQFTQDAGETVTRDAAATGSGTGTSALSGNISTTGTDEVVFGAFKNYSGNTSSAWQIGDTNADAQIAAGVLGYMWYRILTATAADIHAQATVTSANWICHIIAFKSAAASGLSIPIAMSSYRRFKL